MVFPCSCIHLHLQRRLYFIKALATSLSCFNFKLYFLVLVFVLFILFQLILSWWEVELGFEEERAWLLIISWFLKKIRPTQSGLCLSFCLCTRRNLKILVNSNKSDRKQWSHCPPQCSQDSNALVFIQHQQECISRMLKTCNSNKN